MGALSRGHFAAIFVFLSSLLGGGLPLGTPPLLDGAPVTAVFLSPLLGGGLPLGMPPLSEDPVLARVAPEQCLVYLSSAGMATPQADSLNQTEQLLAEPEVRRLAAEIQRAITASLAREMKDKEAPERPSADDIVALAKLALTRPAAVYLAAVQFEDDGPVIGSLRAGMVVNLGDNLEKAKSVVEQLVARIPPPLLDTVTLGGQSWQRFRPAPGVAVVWGFKDQHFWLGIGEGELEAMLKRVAGQPPAWLEQLHRDLPIQRLSNVTYVNLKGVVEAAADHPRGRMAAEALKGFGLDNLTVFRAVAGLDRQGVVSRTLATIDGKPKGLLQLLDGPPLTAADLAVIPADATFAAAVKLDPKKAYQVFLSVAAKDNPYGKRRLEAQIAAVEAALGLKLEEQVFAPLGDTWRVFDSPGEGGALLGLTAVVPLKDPKQAAATQARLLELVKNQPQADEDAGPHSRPARISTTEFSGRTIHVYDAGGAFDLDVLAPAWCLTDKELIVALGPQSVKAYLSRPAGFQSLAQAPAVAAAVRDNAGLLGVTYCNCQRIFDMLYLPLGVWAQVARHELRLRGIELDAGLLPSARAIRSHLGPAVSVVRRTPAGIETRAWASLPCITALSSASLAPAVLLLWSRAGSSPARVYPPYIDAVAAGKKAIELYDTDKDGSLSGDELDKCPGLKAACTPTALAPSTVDPAGTGQITAQMITDRIKAWQASRLGRMSLRCLVKHNGAPLVGADVKFVPEKFLGPHLKTATGRTDQNGVAMLSIPHGSPPGVPPGFYRVEITKADTKIPAKYNKKTIFGQEVAIDAAGIRNGIRFDLEY